LVYFNQFESHLKARPERRKSEVAIETVSNTDVLLIERIVKREADAMSELYDRYASLLFSLLLRILRDEREAEDALQEVFLKIWERASMYNALVGSPPTWIVRVARNYGIDILRSKHGRNRQRYYHLDEYGDIEDGATSGRPESGAIRSQEREEVAKALSELPADQRVLIEMAYYNGYTQTELAEHFKIVGTVKTRMRSGMARLRMLLHHLI